MGLGDHPGLSHAVEAGGSSRWFLVHPLATYGERNDS
jgi:hypothetical protein